MNKEVIIDGIKYVTEKQPPLVDNSNTGEQPPTISTDNSDVQCLSLNDIVDCWILILEEVKKDGLATFLPTREYVKNIDLYKKFQEKVTQKLKQ